MSPNASRDDGAIMARSLVEKRPQAIQDPSDIALYLADQSGRDDLAFHFLDAAESSFEDLAAMPTMGTARDYVDSALADVRLWRVAGFDNYLIFYRRTESGIEVIRVLHAKRDIDALFGSQSRTS